MYRKGRIKVTQGSWGKKFTTTLWARITNYTVLSTGPLALPFACSLAPLTRLLTPLTCLLALHYSLCTTRFACALRCAHSLIRGTVIILGFFFILANSAPSPICSSFPGSILHKPQHPSSRLLLPSPFLHAPFLIVHFLYTFFPNSLTPKII